MHNKYVTIYLKFVGNSTMRFCKNPNLWGCIYNFGQYSCTLNRFPVSYKVSKVKLYGWLIPHELFTNLKIIDAFAFDIKSTNYCPIMYMIIILDKCQIVLKK